MSICDLHGNSNENDSCSKCRDEKQVMLSDELDRIAATLRLLGGMKNHAAMSDLLEEASGNVALVAEVLRGEA